MNGDLFNVYYLSNIDRNNSSNCSNSSSSHTDRTSLMDTRSCLPSSLTSSLSSSLTLPVIPYGLPGLPGYSEYPGNLYNVDLTNKYEDSLIHPSEGLIGPSSKTKRYKFILYDSKNGTTIDTKFVTVPYVIDQLDTIVQHEKLANEYLQHKIQDLSQYSIVIVHRPELSEYSENLVMKILVQKKSVVGGIKYKTTVNKLDVLMENESNTRNRACNWCNLL